MIAPGVHVDNNAALIAKVSDIVKSKGMMPMTPDEARAMRGVMKEVAELNHNTRELMRKTGIDIYVQRADRAQSVIDPLILENQEALLARAVTWGEYNQKRSELARLAPDAAGDFEGTDLKLDTH